MAQDKPSVDTRPAESDNQVTDEAAVASHSTDRTPDEPANGQSEIAAEAADSTEAGVAAAQAEPMSEEGAAYDTADAPLEDVADVVALKASLEEANSTADQSRDEVLRIRAEMENLRKRQARELENAHKYALDKIALELLPVRDTLEMGVAAAETDGDLSKIAEGTGLTLKMLTQALEKFNVVEVDPEGDKFDPDLHQAISVQEGTDKPANTVLLSLIHI